MNQRPWSPISCKCNELNLMTMMLGLCNPISFKKGDKYLITKKKKKNLMGKGDLGRDYIKVCRKAQKASLPHLSLEVCF